MPGPINAGLSRGPNRLIKEGAALVDCLDDILNALQLNLEKKVEANRPDLAGSGQRLFALTPKEASLYEVVARRPIHIDELSAALELTPGEVSAMVLSLELKGALVQLPGSFYSIN